MCHFNKHDYIYQSFWFKNEIKEMYYSGDGFFQYSKTMNEEELINLASEMMVDKESFMPTLVKTIENLINKDYCHYDFWEFGDEDFSLYWFIKKDVYSEKMRLIRKWVEFEELGDLVWFKEELVTDQ